MKFLIGLMVTLFLALGSNAGAQEEVEPQAYKTQPVVMIVMKSGDTLGGVCQQIKNEGNLPSFFESSNECGLRVAENHTGLKGEEALEAAKRIPAGAAVMFPFKTMEQVAADHGVQLASLQSELDGAKQVAQDLSERLTRSEKLQILAAAKEKIAEEKAQKLTSMANEALKKARVAESKVTAANQERDTAKAERKTAVEKFTVVKNSLAMLAGIDDRSVDTEIPLPWLEGREWTLFFGLALLACLFWMWRGDYADARISAMKKSLDAKERDMKGREAMLAQAVRQSTASWQEMKVEHNMALAELATMKNGVVRTFSLPNEPEVSAEFTRVNKWQCSCGVQLVSEGNELQHLANAHKKYNDSKVVPIGGAAH